MAGTGNQIEQAQFKASDILKAAGLTYRQLHDWENRAEVVNPDRATEEGWRKFNFEEVLGLGICAGLRRHFSLSLDRLGKLYRWLVGVDTDEIQQLRVEVARLSKSWEKDALKLLALDREAFKAAMINPVNKVVIDEYVRQKLALDATRPCVEAYKLAWIGFPVYLYTDFQEHAILTENNFAAWIAERLIERPVIIQPLNDIINKVRQSKNLPAFTLDRMSVPFGKQWKMLLEREDVTTKEKEVLKLIRSKKYQKIAVKMENGAIIRVELEENLSPAQLTGRENEIVNIIKEQRYQTITIGVQDGSVVRVNRRASINFPQ